jgi:uncharacterized protein YjbI with pentapeptide repeats
MTETIEKSRPQQKNRSWQHPFTHYLWSGIQVLLLPVVLLVSLVWFGLERHQVERMLGKQQHDTAITIAQDQQQTALLANYMDHISTMILSNKLLHSTPTDDARVAAEAQTLTVLPQLDAEHKGMLLRFLMQTKLINNDLRVINLRDADLHGAQLHGADLRDTYLLGANLSGADLSGVNLSYASLAFTNLSAANLTGADLQSAEMQGANLTSAILKGANLKDILDLHDDQLVKAKSLTGATMPDGSTHP